MTFDECSRIADEALTVNDPALLIDVGRALRRAAGLDPSFPAEDLARRLVSSPPHARGFLVDSLDDAEAHLLRVDKRDRWT